MDKRVYGFEVLNNDNKEIKYMAYINKENLLTPIKEEFQMGWEGGLLGFEEIITILIYNKINKLITYNPTQDTICKHSYEIGNDFEFELCEETGHWNKYDHFEIDPSKEQEALLIRSNIKLIHLNNKKVSKLEKNLKFHETF